jgi:hypothetical protein
MFENTIKSLLFGYSWSKYKMRKLIKSYKLTLFFLFSFGLQVFAQDIAIGQWRDHLPYNQGEEIAVAGKLIFSVADGNLFYLNTESSELFKCSKATGFSDVDVSSIAYDKNTKILVVGYKNTNVDLFLDNKIINISDIKRKNIFGNKTINKVIINESKAYLCCGFGIVVIDLIKKEVKDTYYIGNLGASVNVNEIAFSSDTIYAATAQGIYKAKKNNSFLSDYSSWNKDPFLPSGKHKSLTLFNSRIYTLVDSTSAISRVYFRSINSGNWQVLDYSIPYLSTRIKTTKETEIAVVYEGLVSLYNANNQRGDIFGYLQGSQPSDLELDEADNLWIADRKNCLVKKIAFTNDYVSYRPQGPASAFAINMDSKNGILWVSPGGASGLNAGFRIGSVSKFQDNNWYSLDGYYIYGKTGAFDLMAISANPNNPDNVFVSTWGKGVLELRTDSVVNHFTQLNSSLVTLPINNDIRSQGLDFDNNGNLWIANSGTTAPLALYTKDKKWKSFTFENIALPNVLQLIVASSGQKWLVVERNGMIVYDDAGTPENESDDKVKNLKFEAGKGGIPGSDVFCMAEDRNGEIWMGTDKGVGVFYAPQTVFDESAQDAQAIKISQDGYVQFLLESEKVTAIAVDNANRKWIGTANTGVYLMNSDGTQQLKHFTEENSPLISDGITSINILETTGEVFFGTEKGIVSYKDVATEGFSECKDILVYPNPVRENYTGPIAIRSLVQDANVKITDASGVLVYETKAFGGQAIWDGTNYKGEKVASGVYFAFASSSDGSRGCNAKILIIR